MSFSSPNKDKNVSTSLNVKSLNSTSIDSGTSRLNRREISSRLSNRRAPLELFSITSRRKTLGLSYA